MSALHRAFVGDWFVFGAAFSALVAVALLSVRGLPAGSRPDGARTPDSTSLRAWQMGLAFFAVAFVSRMVVVGQILGPTTLFSDEELDSCICPLQKTLGLPVWGGNSNYVHYSLTRLVLDTLGYEPLALRVFQALRFAAAVGAFVALLAGALPAWPVLGAAGLLVFSYPFIWHSIWSTALGSGALPALVAFGVLLRSDRIDGGTALLLGALLGASLYVYPGAFLAIGCAVAFHVLLYRDRWRLAGIAIFAGAAIATKLVLDVAYGVPFVGASYGGGALSAGHFVEALRKTPADFFYRSTTWASLNFEGPYFEPVLLWMLALGFVNRSRFFAFALGAFLLNVLLVGITGMNPGGRRAMWALPLLYLGCLHASFAFAEGRPRLAVAVKSAFLLSVACLGARYLVIAWEKFPIYRGDSFYPAVVGFLEPHAPLHPDRVVLFEDREHSAFRSRQHWCALAYTRRLWRGERPSPPLLLPKGRPHPSRSREDHWVLLQTPDTRADIAAAFGPRDESFLFPPGVPPPQRYVVPNARVLRIVRVRPR